MGVAITDVNTGLQAYSAILAALLERDAVGGSCVGQRIEVSLLESQIQSLVNVLHSLYLCSALFTLSF